MNLFFAERLHPLWRTQEYRVSRGKGQTLFRRGEGRSDSCRGTTEKEGTMHPRERKMTKKTLQAWKTKWLDYLLSLKE
jgi:hypothetical protein